MIDVYSDLNLDYSHYGLNVKPKSENENNEKYSIIINDDINFYLNPDQWNSLLLKILWILDRIEFNIFLGDFEINDNPEILYPYPAIFETNNRTSKLMIINNFNKSSTKYISSFPSLLSYQSIPKFDKIVTFKIEGRLGNQMFELSTALKTALSDGSVINYYDPKSPYSPYQMTIQFINLIKFDEIKEMEITTPGFEYQPIIKTTNRIFLNTYFQNVDYFKDIRDHLINLFRASLMTISYLRIKYPQVFDTTIRKIMIHYRRTDYLHVTGFFPNLSITSYYDKCFNQIKINDNDYIMIFSDDINWCRQNVLINRNNVHYMDQEDTYTQHVLMCYFDIYIISNSTFSWFSAFLSETAKHIYIPEPWCIGPKTNLALDSWIKMSY
jgi:hypothetical protein